MPRSLTPDLAAWLNGRDYPQLFAEVFGDSAVTPVRIALAIATYERTLFTNQAPIDDFLAGNNNALTAQEARGFNLFNSGRTGCAVCHGGPLFSDKAFHYTGVTPQNEDPGLGAIDGDPGHIGQMKTPSLRNVELRAPYFHNGNNGSLAAVVGFYDRGGNFNGSNKAPGIRPLGLTAQERADLVAFLGRPLTDPRVADGLPPFDRPQLYGESDARPQLFGQPTLGSGGIAPQMVALEPALAGNPSLTVGLDHALGSTRAFLAVDTADDPAGTVIQGIVCYLALTESMWTEWVQVAGSGPGTGTASVSLEVPTTASLIGRTFYGQWVVEDAAGPEGWAASAAAAWTVFQ